MTGRARPGVGPAAALALAMVLAACTANTSSVTSSEPNLRAAASPTTNTPMPSSPPVNSRTPAASASVAADRRSAQLEPTAEASSDAISRLAATRVFFGHQSVGFNVMRGINLLAESSPSGRPAYVSLAEREPLPENGFFAHAKVGRNKHPEEKLADFADTLRSGLAEQVDVAVMKFCYLDVRSGTDVEEVFGQYRSTFQKLEKEYPDVTFIYATVPLQAQRPADNVARARFNSLIREEYSDTGRLWDIAKAESTRPNGKRVRGMYNGQRYDALYRGYTEDGGHLNKDGAMAAADQLVELIAQS